MKLSCLFEQIVSKLPDGISKDIEVTNVTCDSKQVEPGSVFVCVQGGQHDGHAFAKDALQSGAVAIVCERDLKLPGQILVAESRIVYARLCANFYGNPSQKLKLIGVTGTNGKTTTTSLICHVLKTMGKKAGLIGTIHNQIGETVLPSTHTTPDPRELQEMLAQMVETGCEYCVMEVSSHALDQHRLEGCHFSCAVFTNLTQDHLDYHKTMENYYLAKRKLFEMTDQAIVNIDDPYGKRLVEEISCPIHTFSIRDDDADFTAHNIEMTQESSSFALVGKGVIERMKIAMPGEYSISNTMAAASCLYCMEFPLHDISLGLSQCRGVAGRTEILPVDGNYTIIRDYAHTPDGLEKVLTALRGFAKGRVVTLFGCGGMRDQGKRAKMAKVAQRLSDLVILTSDNPRGEDPSEIIRQTAVGFTPDASVKVISDRYDAIKWAVENAKDHDMILLAGKGHEDYQILSYATIFFDEKAIVKAIVEDRKLQSN